LSAESASPSGPSYRGPGSVTPTPVIARPRRTRPDTTAPRGPDPAPARSSFRTALRWAVLGQRWPRSAAVPTARSTPAAKDWGWTPPLPRSRGWTPMCDGLGDRTPAARR